MSRARPVTAGRPRPVTTPVVLRDTFALLDALVYERLAERGHGAVRPAHGVVFQHLDDDGTTVSTLAERAQMTKQAMGELVQRLESLDYVTRVPDPADRRAKLVRPTDRGAEVIAIAQELAAELERDLDDLLGPDRRRELLDDLERVADYALRRARGGR